jgi:NADH dehydrogenase
MATDDFNKVNGTENIYAIGDTCIQLTDTDFPGGHPQVAQVAIQQGLNLAENFKLRQQNFNPLNITIEDRWYYR